MAWPEPRRGGFLAAVAARAERWLIEPAAPRPRTPSPDVDTRAVVAVIGLAARCGSTTLARALAIELARRDRSGAAIVSASARGGASALATGPARRLARALSPDLAAAVGRLCLIDPDDPALRELAVSRPAPLVLDIAHGTPPEAAMALSDAVVLVACPSVEPVLADVVAASLTRGDRTPALVLNRATELGGGWAGRNVITVGEARVAARLALAGRDPTAALARPMADLADALVGEAGR